MADSRYPERFSDTRRAAISRGPTLEAILASKRERRQSRERPTDNPPWLNVVSWVGRAACLLAAVVFAWVAGGVDFGAQIWLGGLILVALAAWWVEQLLGPRSARRGLPLVVVPVVLGIGIGMLQLVPLPDGMAQWAAPKQQELLETFASPAGMVDSPPTPATRISLDPFSGRYQIGLLCFALCGVILGAHFFQSTAHVISFLVVVATNAALVAVAGLLQRIPISGQTLLSTELVSGVLPFATYVNRNNAAGYLLMGMAAAAGLLYWNLFGAPASRRPRPIISREIPLWRQLQQRIGIFIAEMTVARFACLMLVGLITLGVIGSLSRGGVLALLVGGLLTAMTYGIVRDSESRVGWAALALVTVLAISLWLGFGSQLAQRLDELNRQDAVTNLNRFRNWADTLPAVADFGALGSGLGAYHAVHRLYRQDVEVRMFEHADNQYFQTLIDGGWISLVLLLSAVVWTFWAAFFISKHGNSTKTLAIGVTHMFLISSIAVASMLDFGLLIPQNTILMAMFVGMMASHTHAFAGRLRRPHFFRRDVPRPIGLCIAALATIGTALATYGSIDLARMERLQALEPLRIDHLALPDEEAKQQIEQLEPLVARTPTYWGYRRLGELYLHRYRLARLREIADRIPESPAQLWESTNLVNLFDQMQELRRIGDRRLIEAMGAGEAAQEFIVPAWRALIASRNLLPFQTDVQLMLGQIQSIFGDEDKSLICLDRSYQTAPTNADFAFVIGLMHLYAGRNDAAVEHWRRCISLKPNPYFNRVLERIHLMPGDRWRIEPEVVLEKVVPPDPYLLYAFAHQHLSNPKHAELAQRSLHQADELLDDASQFSDPKAVSLTIRVKQGLGKREEALEKMKWLIRMSPDGIRLEEVRFEMARLLAELERYSEAYEEIKWLRKNDAANAQRYSRLYEELRQRLARPPED